MASGGKGGGQVVGYKYYIGMHMVLCRTADALLGISVGQRILWNRNAAGNGFNPTGVATTQDFSINEPELFGGDSREGGISGLLGIKFGEPTQVADGYLKRFFGQYTPAFRGVVSVILKEMYIGLNPYLKNWMFLLTRTKSDWMPNLSAIPCSDGYMDINPAHMIYACITNPGFGMGYPTGKIDDESFGYAAHTLYTEGFGLSLIWDQQGKVEDFIQKILNHINGVVYQSRRTGKFHLKLLRADYKVSDLPVFDEDNLLAITSHQIPLWSETVNEVVASYTDRLTANSLSITVQDLANHQIQKAIVSRTNPYPGICSGDLASRVAQRDLQIFSTPLAKIKFTANRQAWDLNAGDVFVLHWQKLNIAQKVFRVGDVDYGTMENNDISVTAVEDVFAMPAVSVGSGIKAPLNEPQLTPIPAPLQRLIEVNFWELVLRTGTTTALQQATDSAWVLGVAARPSPTTVSFQLSTSAGGPDGPFNAVSNGHYSPSCILPVLVAEDVTTVTYTNDTDFRLLEVGDYGYIGNEAVMVLAFDTEAKTITLYRGVLDTVPMDHVSGQLYITSQLNGSNVYEYVDGELVYGRILPVFPLGKLPMENSTSVSLTVTARQARPYAPGGLKLNGNRFPASVSKSAALVLTWARRNRAQQTVDIPLQTDGDITPESGTTYTARVTHPTLGVLATVAGIAGTTTTIASTAFVAVTSGSTITVEVWAVRGGITSYQNATTVCHMN